MLLEARGLRKQFTGVLALDGVDFSVRPGEIHALMGENGAGKSTLIKVLTGVYQPDAGEVLLAGQPYSAATPHEATSKGISTVYQEVNLVPNLTVAENVCLGREPRGALGIQWRAVKDIARKALAKLGVEVDVDRPLGSLSIAEQQLTAIARALDVSCKVLILDEPTSSLDSREVSQLFGVLKKLKADGLGIVFVTHFIDQVYEISDRITVLRNGKLVGEYETKSFDRMQLVSAMIGRSASDLTQSHMERDHDFGATVCKAADLSLSNSVNGVSFQVREGDVVGLAGLLGSGRTETLRLIYGIDRPTSGRVTMFGESITSPSVAIRHGAGLCPEDRKAEGIMPELSVRENLILVVQNRRGWWRKLSRREQNRIVQNYIDRLKIATSDAEKPIQFLSGGNQQKVLLARWLAANPKLLLLDEPTRGIDVGAKFEISELVEELRKGGMAFLFVSSELEEVVRSSTKVVVMRDRSMVGELQGSEINEDAVMDAIARGGQ